MDVSHPHSHLGGHCLTLKNNASEAMLCPFGAGAGAVLQAYGERED
jgi:hypothetical protein